MNKVMQMNEIEKQNAKILVIVDCAKVEHTLHFYEVANSKFHYKKPLHVKNNSQGFAYFMEHCEKILKQQKLQIKDVCLIMEDPASYSLNFMYNCQKTGLKVFYVNAYRASLLRKNSRASSDTLDLDGILKMALLGNVYIKNESDDLYMQLRDATRQRKRLVKEESKNKVNMHNLLDRIFPGFLCKNKSSIDPFSKGCLNLMAYKNFSPSFFIKTSPEKVIKVIENCGLKQSEKIYQSLKNLAQNSLDLGTDKPEVFLRLRSRLQVLLKLFNERKICIEIEEENIAQLLQFTPYTILTSIPGVGITLASVFAAEVGNAIYKYNDDKIASYAGIVPRQKQSGGRSKAPVTFSASKASNKMLKDNISSMARLTKEHHHPSFKQLKITHSLKAFFEKVELRKGSSYLATARKMVRIISIMVRQENIYMPDLKQITKEQANIWIELGTEKMFDKWKEYGIYPNEQNYLGKWLKVKEAIIEMHKEFK